MKNKLIFTIFFLSLFSCGKKEVKQEDLRYVIVEEASFSKEVPASYFSGFSKSEKEIDISFRVPGQIVKIPIKVGDQITKGKLIASLDDKHDQIFMIEQRILGLMSRHEKPCNAVDDLISSDLRFVNRQAGSTTRLTFDGLLKASGFSPEEIKGYQDEEYTHTAVGALVVSCDVDVAFGSQSAAEHFDLNFEPMIEERFYLVINREFDNSVRQFVTEFCAGLEFPDAEQMSPGEFVPKVAIMKRVHNAGSWK